MQYLKGFGNYNKPWNFDGQLRNSFLKDTLGTAKSLARTVFVLQIGLNKVLANDDKNNPLIEFELAFEDTYIQRRMYAGEDRNKISLNSILRVHISKEMAIPLTLKYDSKKANVFGLFQVSWNLENKRSNESK